MGADGDDGNRSAAGFFRDLLFQLADDGSGVDDIRQDAARQVEPGEERVRPRAGLHVHHLRRTREGVFAEDLSAEMVADQIGDEDQRAGAGQGRVALRPHGEQLVETVELHELEAGVLVDLASRHEPERFVQHAVGAGVAVVVRVLDKFSVAVEQGEVHAPTVHGDAGDRAVGLPHTEADAALDLIEDLSQEIPSKGAVLLDGPVGKAMDLGELQRPAGERPQHETTALGAHVNGDELLRLRHLLTLNPRPQTIPASC